MMTCIFSMFVIKERSDGMIRWKSGCFEFLPSAEFLEM